MPHPPPTPRPSPTPRPAVGAFTGAVTEFAQLTRMLDACSFEREVVLIPSTANNIDAAFQTIDHLRCEGGGHGGGKEGAGREGGCPP
jgi:hypothetical protein